MAFPQNFYPGNYLWWKQPTYNYNPENAAAVPAPAPQPVQPAPAIAPQPLPTTMQKLHSPVRPSSSKTTTPPLSYPPPPPPPPPPKDKVISLDFHSSTWRIQKNLPETDTFCSPPEQYQSILSFTRIY